MFNTIRNFILILGLFLLANAFTTKVNAAESDLHNQEEIIYLAPDLDLSIATEEEIKILEEIGWNLEAEIPYLVVEKETETSAESSDKHLETNQGEVLLVIDLGELFDKMPESELNAETSEEFTIIPYHNMPYQPIYSPPAHGTKVYKFGDKVHCNRFNGPKSDNKHYSKFQPKALINFNGSDCDTAVRKGYCKLLNDHCNSSSTYHRGWCSEKIGHNVNYHKH
ncbi:hypothetical protein JTF06_08725 [Desemzia sp. RIT804]|uniref:hypothetical protein n=1 Tax=Desemzia sp. RIT 804 TaxID=2810209 RepID=UPI00194E7BA2|nr:hypothetical protein [Desemzia sp. RIT 804]MBM6614974.1 hypothetical protein [Desemzia sp. RIT 804]